jgi:pimeloyl-ACP methyl ester carboxylesterase
LEHVVADVAFHRRNVQQDGDVIRQSGLRRRRDSFSYRHRNLNAPGEPRFTTVERQLAERPKISVPSIVLYGADDGLGSPPADTSAERALFTALVARRVVAGTGHFMPREKPGIVSAAILELLDATRERER